MRLRLIAFLIAAVIVSARPAAAAPMSEAWIDHAPTVAQVFTDTQNADPIEAAARQAAAFQILIFSIQTWTGSPDTRFMSPRAAAKYNEYSHAYSEKPYGLKFNDGACNLGGCTRYQFAVKEQRYSADLRFTRQVLQRYFSSEYVEAEVARETAFQKEHPEFLPNPNPLPESKFFSELFAVIYPIAKWALILVAGWFGIRGLKRLSERSSARWAKRREKYWTDNNQSALEQFGSTQGERTTRIDSVFDKKASNIDFHLDDPPSGLKCDIFRALSAMSAKEREALRAAYHLYNLGMMRWNNFYLVRLGLIYGDGKGAVTGERKYSHSESIRSITDAIRRYLEPNNAESMMTAALSDLTESLRENPDHPDLRKIAARLYGDGGDLAPGAPLTLGNRGDAIGTGLVLGLDEKSKDKWWCYDGEGSLITIAPPGSGKTQAQVLPNLLMWKGPAVVLDVKGEIYDRTSKWRQDNVGPVFRFNPLDPLRSHCYNPLTLVRSDPEYLWEDSRFLADMMIVPSNAKDPFWENRARDVLTAAVAYVCLQEDVTKRPMGTVLDIVHGVAWDKFVAYLAARADIRSMSRAGQSLASMEARTRDGVLQTAQSLTSAWAGERLERATSKSDWNPLDLRSGRNPTIYICLKPNEIDSYISVLRVVIAQHIRALTTELPPRGSHPILFMLDELSRLRHMPPVEEALEIGRQYGVKLWMFSQSLGQLENAYDNADGMIGSCAIRMFMNPSLHDETAQKISDDIGFQDSVVDGSRVKIVEPNVLAGPDFKDIVIVMAANAKAARLKKYPAYEDRALLARMGSL